MGRKSKISQLPPEIKETIDGLIRDGRATIDEIKAKLEELGASIPRSTIGDYKQSMEKKLERYREAQAVASVWVGQLGEQADSKTGQLLAEMLKSIAFRTLADMQEHEAGTEAGELMLLARALKDMAAAQKTDHEFRVKVRAEVMAEQAAKAELAQEEITKVARSAGLTDEAAARMREIVLGVVG